MQKLANNKKLLKKFLESGAVIVDPESTFIDKNISLSKGCVIFPQTYLLGKTKIGQGSQIGPNVKIANTKIGNYCQIEFSVISDSIIKNKVTIGPFAHIRPETYLDDESHVGSFAEVKKSKVGRRSQVPHICYLGDAELGKDINYGAGAITCNYDGKDKHETIIEDNVFIGSGVELIAPIKIKKGAYVAAGSTVASKKDIPGNSLVICRRKDLVIKKNWEKNK